MSSDTWPVVYPDERIIVYELNRLSDRVEDVLAQWVVRFMLDPALVAHGQGVVLQGFKVDQIDLPASQLRIRRGVAIVPIGAPKDASRNDANAGMSASWRVVATTADIIINLALPGVGVRTDHIMVARQYVDHIVEAREFRVPGDPDDAAENQNVATLRAPQGAVVQATAYQVGTVRIAEVDLDADGSTAIRDVRVMAWPVDGDSPANIDSSKPHAYGLRPALVDLFSRVPKVIHPDGLARLVVPADGGDDIEVDDDVVNFGGHYMSLGSRRLVLNDALFRSLIIRETLLAASFEPPAAQLGRTVHGSNIVRAYAIVRVTKDENNDVVGVHWVGHGITSITTPQGHTFDITFNDTVLFIAATPGFGGLTTSRWILAAQPHHTAPGYAGEEDSGGHNQPKLCTVEAVDDNTARVRTFAYPDSPGEWELRAFSFWVQLYGPIMPSLGAEPAAAWTSIFP